VLGPIKSVARLWGVNCPELACTPAIFLQEPDIILQER
jgi:hypothetical protein